MSVSAFDESAASSSRGDSATAMFVKRYVPSAEAGLPPVVMIHGRGQTGGCFEATPDGRPGWAHDFAAAGHAVYVVDQVGVGRSDYAEAHCGPRQTTPVERIESYFTCARRSGLWPQAALHTQWPGSGTRGCPVFERFLASQVPYLADAARAEALNRDALVDLLERIGPAVLVTHSQSGPYGWLVGDCRPDLVTALVAVEPNGPPFYDLEVVGAPHFFRDGPLAREWGLTRLPLQYDPPARTPEDLGPRRAAPVRPGEAHAWLQGGARPRKLPNLGGVPVALVTGEASFRAAVDACTGAFLEQAGVAHEHVRLEQHGIRGNGHMMMVERNSSEIAQLIVGWLRRNAARREPNVGSITTGGVK